MKGWVEKFNKQRKQACEFLADSIDDPLIRLFEDSKLYTHFYREEKYGKAKNLSRHIEDYIIPRSKELYQSGARRVPKEIFPPDKFKMFKNELLTIAQMMKNLEDPADVRKRVVDLDARFKTALWGIYCKCLEE